MLDKRGATDACRQHEVEVAVPMPNDRFERCIHCSGVYPGPVNWQAHSAEKVQQSSPRLFVKYPQAVRQFGAQSYVDGDCLAVKKAVVGRLFDVGAEGVAEVQLSRIRIREEFVLLEEV